jgi:4'-phosphopantetheinyl transferase
MKDVRFEIRPVNPAMIESQFGTARLQPERKRRIDALKRKEAIAASLLGDWLARKNAAELLSCAPDDLLVADGERGKPQIIGRDIHISITHSGGYAAAAAATRPIGIDLERQRPLPKTLFMRICSPEELNWVRAVPSLTLARFFRLWTMKEAYGKMKGIGIFTDRRFSAGFVEGQLIELYPDCLFLFPDAPDGYSASICLARER